MKQILPLLALLLLVSIGASAQKKLGDYIDINGVPAFIFQLDDMGEHGLAMTIPRNNHAFGLSKYSKRMTKIIDKMSEEGKLSSEEVSHLKEYFNSQGTAIVFKKDKELRPLYTELIERLSNNGKTNAEQVDAFCKEKGISMKDFFPTFYAAKEQGKGWFLPGDKELEELAVFYLGGLGKNNGLGALKWSKQPKMKSDNELVQEALTWITRGQLYSSSMNDPKAGFRKLAWTFMKLSAKNYLDIYDRVPGDVDICFVYEF
jgi:hypothetical protein